MSPPLEKTKRSRRENPIVFLDIQIAERRVGRLTIELRADVVPKTAENFRRLCTGETSNPWTGRRRQYAHCPVHRVIKGKFCQSGDVVKGGPALIDGLGKNQDGSGGECTFDQPEDDEGRGFADATSARTSFDDENFILRHTGAGVLSMVNSGPDTNTSQFYLHFAPNAHLDDLHVVFGCLMGPESFEVLGQIHAVASERGDPKWPVRIAASGQLYPA